MSRLTTTNHDRDSAGMTYVYPVVSRRARGVSVGINLNPNNACNWRCVYCQVPDLVRGKAPPIDLDQLRTELDALLRDVVEGDFMTRQVPEGSRRLNDVAFSGNGEATTSAEFPAALEVVAEALERFGLLGQIKVVLISNGSMHGQPRVQEALTRLAELNGEVWFKLDSATKEGLSAINSVAMDPAAHLARLRQCAERCPTWIQTCVFSRGGEPPDERELSTYLSALRELIEDGVSLRGVLLYSLARPSFQPEAEELGRLEQEWLDAFAARIEALGLEVRASA